MSNWRENCAAIAEEYLKRANGDVDAAVQLLTEAIKGLPVPVDGDTMLDYLNARAWLRDRKL